MEKIKTEIFLDGPTEKEIIENRSERIKGYTFNPSLFKNLGVTNYVNRSIEFAKIASGKSISLEVIADDVDEMTRQAILLSNISDNVSVKIPILFTNGQYTDKVLTKLVAEKVKLNITAVFTLDQVKMILPIVKNTDTIISVFAGRLFDIGLDANKIMDDICKFVHDNSDCRVLWASPRMSFDYFAAGNINCDIITMSVPLYKKLSLVGKKPEQYSIDTVKMFFDDAISSGYKF